MVARRQGALWAHWRPWLVLVGIAVPLATVLSLGSKMAAHHSSVPIWMYVNNWTMAYLRSPGARQDLVNNGTIILSQYLILAAWSWASGLLLGSLSRRTISVNGALFCLVVLLPGLWQALLAGWHSYSGSGTSSAFYSVIFPLMVQVVVVLAPSVLGMYQGPRAATVPGGLRTMIWVSAVTTIATLAVQNWVWLLCLMDCQQACMDWVAWAGYARIAGVPQRLQIPTLPLALAGPVGYVIAMAVWRRRRSEPARV